MPPDEARPRLSDGSRALFERFAARPGAGADRAAALRRHVESSPALVRQLNQAVAADELRGFTVQPADVNAGGTYDPSTRHISVPLSQLEDRYECVFVMGHEVQHALNRAAVEDADTRFPTDLHQQASSGSLDYTTPVATLMQAQRWDEASANLAGWNALVSHHTSAAAEAGRPQPSLATVAASNGRTRDVVEGDVLTGYHVRPNLSLGPDLTAELTPANIEGMAQNYVDRPAAETRLGHHGNSDYANYYGAYAVGVTVQYHRAMYPPQPGVAEVPFALDLQRLGLDRALMEQNGVHLGGSRQPMPFLDTSTTPPRREHLHHTFETHQHVPTSPASDAARRDPSRAGRTDDLRSMSFPRSPAHAGAVAATSTGGTSRPGAREMVPPVRTPRSSDRGR
ncbi:hypothetical protein DT076_00690 [Desertihabitans brevis]|uniref:Uncharacterized protein n=1 Tax=Desertihabitans brevis TaxID=2268447 RepID=A0A367Z182_9ACTN|nr:hypothetical protein [Desertihabitans brevis]RCK71032.1 hypothetical protein DT076_00690 [Desertihabitans brevis]